MTTISITFAHGAMPGHPVEIKAGSIVTVANAPGCTLRNMAGDTLATPYTAQTDTVVKLDCVTYTAPVTATLEIA
jgi:hypothetical protein